MLVKRSHMLCGMIYGRNGIESIPHMKTYMLLRPQIIMKRNAAAIRPSHDPRLHVNIRQTPIAATLISETALPRSPLTKVSINVNATGKASIRYTASMLGFSRVATARPSI